MDKGVVWRVVRLVFSYGGEIQIYAAIRGAEMGFGVIGQFRVEYPVLVRASGEELGRVVMLGIVKQLVQRRNMPRTYGRGKIRLLGDTDFCTAQTSRCTGRAGISWP